MRMPIHRITFTHIELPQALYLGASGQSAAGFPFHGICVQPSGKPISRSVSTGSRRLTVALQPTPGGFAVTVGAGAPSSPIPAPWRFTSSCFSASLVAFLMSMGTHSSSRTPEWWPGHVPLVCVIESSLSTGQPKFTSKDAP